VDEKGPPQVSTGGSGKAHLSAASRAMPDGTAESPVPRSRLGAEKDDAVRLTAALVLVVGAAGRATSAVRTVLFTGDVADCDEVRADTGGPRPSRQRDSS
jgi:hypothetical protein